MEACHRLLFTHCFMAVSAFVFSTHPSPPPPLPLSSSLRYSPPPPPPAMIHLPLCFSIWDMRWSPPPQSLFLRLAIGGYWIGDQRLRLAPAGTYLMSLHSAPTTPVVLETKTTKAATVDILSSHCIPSAMSDDLKT
ncbi:hypothetical protein L2E82_20151 [Cichorium intybus]|uniref:Uncharacterized protein n=1 Tax=Cichorium intybus TaxID=13427 RepID=A0ACB9DSJ6_CICIN|nr:hypothetical protein L2E82_20151 [Cichorium intybus]